ncbi:MAG TPA: Lrp/AsnC family transcriptional regulator [Stellaceae bacterium]|nr:Lrp/AsnC family transcriptional regulator [Stellaceae bacterium]
MRLQGSELLRDERNLALLRLLRENPRAAISDLARGIEMSAPAVRERLLRLEESGVIAGYRTLTDPSALGYPIAVFIRVRPMPGKLPKIVEVAERTPEVVECYRITGEDCFIIKAHLKRLEELDQVLDRFLVYGQTTTSLVQSAPIPLRDLPLPGDIRR